MPQMMPMSWMYLMVYFTLMLMFFNTLIYYVNTNKPLYKHLKLTFHTIPFSFNW
nr:ATP synthase F0 subunit 8 [Metallyticus sp. JZ-2017]